LHSGNILVISQNNVKIGDFGISKPANSTTDTKEIYGVIPYIAPEIFNGEKYTTASDIYSFGMIMWEMTIGQKPFSDRNHDEYLILDILNGLRPELINDLPQQTSDYYQSINLNYKSLEYNQSLMIGNVSNQLEKPKFYNDSTDDGTYVK
ncbi:19553_t:CDS:2, partial [Racocetra fulgida]